MKNLLHYGCVGALAILAGCYPEPETVPLVDDLVVVTNFDPETEFSSYSTYTIPTDTIGFISNNSNDTILVAAESGYPRPVLNALRAELDARGYTEVPQGEDPDIGVKVVVVNNLDIFQDFVYPGYGYPGYYYSGYYGYGGWYYPPYVATYVQNTGVLIVELVDLKNRNANNQVKVVWNAYMGDLYTTVDLIPQTQRAIVQAFVQSPYLTK